jgi:hypothetical protein
MRKFLLLVMFSLASCESDVSSVFEDISKISEAKSSEKSIEKIEFVGYNSQGTVNDSSNTISYIIDCADLYLAEQTAIIKYTGFAIKKDGVVQQNGVTVNDFTNAYTNPVTYTVIAEDGSERDYKVYINATNNETFGNKEDLVITEWADAGSNIDYIEIKNFSQYGVKLPIDLQINYGRTSRTSGSGDSPQTSAALAGYSIDNSTWNDMPTTDEDAIRIAPGEFIFLVDEDMNEGVNLESFRIQWGLAAPVKIFRVSGETALIGTRDRLSYAPAWLSTGTDTWSKTPNADTDSSNEELTSSEYFGSIGTSTYSSLNTSVYVHGTNSTEELSVWVNGSSSTSSPGADYTE